MPSQKPHCIYHIIAEKYIPEPGVEPRSQGLSFNVRAHYQLCYPDRIQFCYANLECLLTTRLPYCVCVLCAEGGGGTCM